MTNTIRPAAALPRASRLTVAERAAAAVAGTLLTTVLLASVVGGMTGMAHDGQQLAAAAHATRQL